MKDRTYVVAGLAIAFLSLQVVGGIAARNHPIEPVPTLLVAEEAAVVCLWVALILGARWPWPPLVAWYMYQTACLALPFVRSGIGDLDLADNIMYAAVVLTQAVPLVALVLDPFWRWKRRTVGGEPAGGEQGDALQSGAAE